MIPALITGGLSAISGLFGSASAAKANKKARLAQIAADVANRDRMDATNAQNVALGQRLLKTPVKTTEQHSGGVRTQYSEWGDVDVDGMMAAAERAGFNPATWLGAGALGAYSRRHSDTRTNDTTKIVTTQTGAHAAAAYGLMSPQTFQQGVAQQQAVPSPMQAVVSGISDGFSAWNADRVRGENQDFQREMLNLSLDAAQQRSLLGRSLGGVPGMVTSGGLTSNAGSGGLSRNGGINALGMPSAPTAGDVTVTNPYERMGVNPRVRDADAWSKRYGEPGEWIGGPYIWGQDMFFNLKSMPPAPSKNTWDKWLGPDRVGAIRDYFGGLSKNFQLPSMNSGGGWMQ